MATTFTKGQRVRVIAVVPEGPVTAFRMDEDGTVWYFIEWVDVAGVTQQRWFKEDELTAA